MYFVKRSAKIVSLTCKYECLINLWECFSRHSFSIVYHAGGINSINKKCHNAFCAPFAKCTNTLRENPQELQFSKSVHFPVRDRGCVNIYAFREAEGEMTSLSISLFSISNSKTCCSFTLWIPVYSFNSILL